MAQHDFKAGDTVTVFNATMGGKFIIEGVAKVRNLPPHSHTYKVEFESEPGRKYIRYVEPGEAQRDPNAFLAARLLGAA